MQGQDQGETEENKFLNPKVDSTINLLDEQEDKGEHSLHCCQLSSGPRWPLFDFAFVFVMKNFVVP